MTPMVYMVSRNLPIFVSAVNKGFGAKRIGRKHMRQAGTSAHLTKVADASRLDPGWDPIRGQSSASGSEASPVTKEKNVKSENQK